MGLRGIKSTSYCYKFALGARILNIIHLNGLVAQSVEQRTENPCVAGSIPVQAIHLKITTNSKISPLNDLHPSVYGFRFDMLSFPRFFLRKTNWENPPVIP